MIRLVQHSSRASRKPILRWQWLIRALNWWGSSVHSRPSCFWYIASHSAWVLTPGPGRHTLLTNHRRCCTYGHLHRGLLYKFVATLRGAGEHSRSHSVGRLCGRRRCGGVPYDQRGWEHQWCGVRSALSVQRLEKHSRRLFPLF